jgi:hypothetical protein
LVVVFPELELPQALASAQASESRSGACKSWLRFIWRMSSRFE